MKKSIVTSVIASMMLLVSFASFAKTTTTINTPAAPAAVVSPSQSAAFDVSFNSERQVLNIRDAAADNAARVTITNDHGNVIYTGNMRNGNSNIDMTGFSGSKYSIQLQDGATNKCYKLLIL